MANGSITELPQPLQLRPQTHRPQSPLQRTLCGAVPIPEDYYFHLGDDQFFATYEEYQKFYEESGTLQGGSTPCGAAFGQHQHAELQRGHMAAIINSLEERG